MIYYYSISGNLVKVTTQHDQYVKVECDSVAPVTLPEVEALRDASVPTVSFERCRPAAGSYAAAVEQLGLNATAVRSLFLRRVGPTARAGRLPSLFALELWLAPEPSDVAAVPALLADLPNYPALAKLKIINATNLLFSSKFTSVPTLRVLEISESDLSSIPDGAFRTFSGLTTLSLWGNGLTSVSADAFGALSSLERLDLSSNKLHELPERVFTDTPLLKTVDLFNNAFELLPGRLFSNLSRLEGVRLFDNAAELSLVPRQFADLPRLASIALERCGLLAIPPELLRGSRALVNISLAGNGLVRLPVDFLADQVGLRRLDLSENRLEELTSEHFAHVRGLRELLLDDNALSLRAASSFVNADEVDYFDFGFRSPFAGLSELRLLSLAGNRITDIFPDWHMNLLALRELDLGRNRIENLTVSGHALDERYINIKSIFLLKPLWV